GGCVGGETAWDTDGLCNNVCALHVQLCINQPEVGNCVPPSGLQRLKFKSHPATFTLSTPSSLLSHQCNDSVTAHLPVKLSKKGKKSVGVLKVTGFAKAVQGTTPLKDSDTYVLKCLPLVGPCPPTNDTPHDDARHAVAAPAGDQVLRPPGPLRLFRRNGE